MVDASGLTRRRALTLMTGVWMGSAGAQVGTRSSFRRLPMRDDIPTDERAAALRRDLRRWVAVRDAEPLLAHVHPDIQLSFGPEGQGIENFVRAWRPHDPRSPFWHELARLLLLGGRLLSPSLLEIPSLFAEWPDDLDRSDHEVVVVRDAILRAAAGAGAAARHRVGRGQIVDVLTHETNEHDQWRHVHAAGHTGWLRRDQLRAPLDLRANFSLADALDGWQMTAFIGGD